MMRWMWGLRGLCRVVGLIALPAIARAQAVAPPAEAPAVHVRWVAPPGCPTESDLRVEVERLLGRSLGSPTEHPLEAGVRVERDPGGPWRMWLETRTPDGSGERAITADSCGALLDATALILALAIDPEAVAAHAAAATSPAPQPPSPPAPTPQAPAAPAPAPAVSDARSRFAARTVVVADVGSLPALAPGIGLAVGLLRGALRFEAQGTYLFRERSTIATLPTAGGSFDLLAFDARACLQPLRARIEGLLCAGVLAGAMRGQGFGVTETTPGSGFWFSLSVSAAVAWPLGRFLAAWAELGVSVPLVRLHFVIESLGEAFASAPIAGRGALGLEIRFR